MSVINTNVSALVAQNALTANSRAQSTAMQQLSTGLRINGAKDDAAGLAIASKMTSQIRGLDQAVRNANDGISMLQTADGALTAVSDMLQRMRELSVQSSSDTNVGTDRTALNTEFQALSTEIGRVGSTTQWNGMGLLDGTGGGAGTASTFTFQIGANNDASNKAQISQTMLNLATSVVAGGDQALTTVATVAGANQVTANTAAITSFTAGQVISSNINGKAFSYTVQAADVVLGGATAVATTLANAASAFTAQGAAAVGVSVSGATTTGKLTFTAIGGLKPFSASLSVAAGGAFISGDISSQAGALTAIDTATTKLATVNAGRSSLGATINRLTYAADNLSNVSQNTSASRSRVQDTDYAKASTELARTQIISQAATAMLAQANQSQQSVLALLK